MLIKKDKLVIKTPCLLPSALKEQKKLKDLVLSKMNTELLLISSKMLELVCKTVLFPEVVNSYKLKLLCKPLFLLDLKNGNPQKKELLMLMVHSLNF